MQVEVEDSECQDFGACRACTGTKLDIAFRVGFVVVVPST